MKQKEEQIIDSGKMQTGKSAYHSEQRDASVSSIPDSSKHSSLLTDLSQFKPAFFADVDDANAQREFSLGSF